MDGFTPACLLLLMTLSVVLLEVSGLTCYKCISGPTNNADANCTAQPFNNEASTVNRVNCPYRDDQFCLKIIFKTSGNVYRECTSASMDGEDACDFWSRNGASYCSLCSDDLCNSGALGSAHLALLLPAILIITINYFS